MILITQFKNRKKISLRLDYFVLSLCLLILFLTNGIVFDTVSNTLSTSLILQVLNIVVPIAFIGYSVKKEEFSYIKPKMMKTINWFVLVLTVLMILDFFTGRGVQFFIAEVSNNPRFKELIIKESYIGYRYYSIWGHPLFNSQLYIFFYIVNMCEERKYGLPILKSLLIDITFILGLILSGGKTGIALGILLIFMKTIVRAQKNILLTLGTTIIITFFSFLSYSIGMADSIIKRFLVKDLTSGRFEAISLAFSSYENPIGVFGNGYNFSLELSRSLTNAATSFELPVIMYLYDYGYFITTMLVLGLFIMPLFYLIKRKRWFETVLLIILIANVNSYNGLALMGDYILFYTISVSFLINHSNSTKLINVSMAEE